MLLILLGIFLFLISLILSNNIDAHLIAIGILFTFVLVVSGLGQIGVLV